MSSFWIQIHGSNSKRYQIYFFLILEFQNRKAKKQVVSNTACQRKWCRWNVLILDLFTFMFFVFYNLGTSETRSSDLSISWAISTSSNLNSKNSMYIITYTVLVNVNKVKKTQLWLYRLILIWTYIPINIIKRSICITIRQIKEANL